MTLRGSAGGSEKDSRVEVRIGRPLLERILSLAGQDMILVGGQALSFWASHYGVPEPTNAITKDADFLGTPADVRRLATGLGGRAHFPHENSLTALMGQVTKDLPGKDYINIDVMFRLYGDITAEAIRTRAVMVELDNACFKVMHPMDVLQSRLENVHGLEEKQDEHGVAQLVLAIEMIRPFLSDEAARDAKAGSRSVVLKHGNRVEAMALSDAGRKVARRFAVHVADAVDPAPLASNKAFMSKKLPQLRELMSAPWRTVLDGRLLQKWR